MMILVPTVCYPTYAFPTTDELGPKTPVVYNRSTLRDIQISQNKSQNSEEEGPLHQHGAVSLVNDAIGLQNPSQDLREKLQHFCRDMTFFFQTCDGNKLQERMNPLRQGTDFQLNIEKWCQGYDKNDLTFSEKGRLKPAECQCFFYYWVAGYSEEEMQDIQKRYDSLFEKDQKNFDSKNYRVVNKRKESIDKLSDTFEKIFKRCSQENATFNASFDSTFSDPLVAEELFEWLSVFRLYSSTLDSVPSQHSPQNIPSDLEEESLTPRQSFDHECGDVNQAIEGSPLKDQIQDRDSVVYYIE